MKSSMRRLLSAAMILVLLLSLAACGKTEGQSDSTQGSASAEAPRTETMAERQPATASESSGTQTERSDKADTDTQADRSAVYNGLFSTDRVHTIDVTISEEDWADLQANPLEKTKYKTTVNIDGETVEEVSFATKGNTSLSSVASDPDSTRYSFKLNFGKYNKDQSYYGLNKLSLNNLYADASYLKDYLSYELFRQLGVDAPLTSFVWLRINGEDHGLYLAIEDVSESWLDRTQDGKGVVYKPETEELDQMGNGGPGGFPGGQNGDGENQGGFPGNFPGGQSGDGENQGGFSGGFPGGQSGDGGNQGGFPSGFPGGQSGDGGNQSGFPGNFPGGQNGDGNMPTPPDGNTSGFPGGMGFGGNAKGADLRYTDDDPESYTDIFDNDETDMDEGAANRVIAALKALSEGSPADALDTDEVIRYFAAHNFVLNYDSYTGSMLHNYYLYEHDGKLSMIPWDYNLAFGGFGGGMGSMGGSDASALINTGIDTPLSGATEDSRPMWAWITANESYLEQYHAALNELLTTYFESGSFEAEMDRLYEMLRPYVEQDATAFYSVEEYDTALETLKQFCLLRAQSIRKQLDGALSTRTDAQEASAQVDASGLNVNAMGGMGGGKDGKRDDTRRRNSSG